MSNEEWLNKENFKTGIWIDDNGSIVESLGFISIVTDENPEYCSDKNAVIRVRPLNWAKDTSGFAMSIDRFKKHFTCIGALFTDEAIEKFGKHNS